MVCNDDDDDYILPPSFGCCTLLLVSLSLSLSFWLGMGFLRHAEPTIAVAYLLLPRKIDFTAPRFVVRTTPLVQTCWCLEPALLQDHSRIESTSLIPDIPSNCVRRVAS